MTNQTLSEKAMSVLKGFSLEGKTAVITGGAKGLGRACALALSGAGANVFIIGKTEANNKMVVDEIMVFGKKADQAVADVCCEKQVEQAMQKAKMVFGSIDILVNSAGIADVRTIIDFDVELWERIMDTNVKGTFICSKEAAKHMLSQGKGGRIINISSLQGFSGRAGDPAYSASKAAVNLMTKSMACEWAMAGICVNAIAPTWCWTDMTSPTLSKEEFYEQLKKRIPAGRAGDLSDLFGLTVYLASDLSSFMNGAIIPLDGGAIACDGFPDAK